MTILSWLRGEGPESEVLEAILPGQREPEGELEKHSPTWVFVRNWAREELQMIREANDSTARNEIQTAVLRGEIKRLKTLLLLPDALLKPSRPKLQQKGILEEDSQDDY